MESQLPNMCRLCMDKMHLSCIFQSEGKVPLDVKAMSCAVITIKIHDGLPAFICDTCKVKLEDFYNFKKICENTDRALRSLLKKCIAVSGTEEKNLRPNFKEEMESENSGKILKNLFNPLKNTTQNEQEQNDTEQISNIKEEIIIKSENECSDAEYSGDYCEMEVYEEKNLNNVKAEPHDTSQKTQCNKNFETMQSKIKLDSKFQRKFKRKEKLSINLKENEFLGKSKNSSYNKPIKTNKKITKSFQCEICGCIYKTKSVLKKHLFTHLKIKPFQCSLCMKRYTRTEHLVVHMRTHSGIKPFVCEMCARSFTKSQDLSRHRRVHSEEKKYKCPRCDKWFKRSSDVHVHMRTHTGVRPYCCKNCDKTYTSHSGLMKHIQNNCTNTSHVIEEKLLENLTQESGCVSVDNVPDSES